MKRLLFLILPLFILHSCSQKDLHISTPLEKTGFTALTTNAQIDNFLQQIAGNPLLQVEVLDTTDEGREIFLVKAGTTPPAKDEKIKVMLVAQQHGNEPSGKEGVLLLIGKIARGEADSLFRKMDLLILPQVNPDGGDKHLRRTAQNIDPNRDQLILESREAQCMQSVFNKYRPEFTVDIHEYYPYRKSWMDFGYVRQFDIQLGCITNINVDEDIRKISKEKILPFAKQHIENEGYSFFEYTLGYFHEGERMRHSTVDIDDGRHSFGIQNTFSFIIEGLNGKDSVYNLERRAKSQLLAIEAILQYAYLHAGEIKQTVSVAREKLLSPEFTDSVATVMEHIKGENPLHYPLVDIETGQDTTFIIDEYHSQVISLHNVTKPKAYLVPASNTQLIDLLDKHAVTYQAYKQGQNQQITAYKINTIHTKNIEGLDRQYPDYEVVEFTIENETAYLEVSTAQLKGNMLVHALEPHSYSGLVNYKKFAYLLNANSMFPVLRIE